MSTEIKILQDSTDEAIARFHKLNGGITDDPGMSIFGGNGTGWFLHIGVYPTTGYWSDRAQEIPLNQHHYVYHVTATPVWSSSMHGISCRRDCLADAINEICSYIETKNVNIHKFDYVDLT